MKQYTAQKPRYYRDADGDYIMIVGVWKEHGESPTYEGAAPALRGNVGSIVGWEFSVGYVQSLERVNRDSVPRAWYGAFQRYVSMGEQVSNG